MMRLSEEKFENEVDEFGWFAEDLMELEELLAKLSHDQQVFINTLKEVVDSDNESEEWVYEHLVLAGCIEMYNRKPELVPNAPLVLLKKCLPSGRHMSEFKELEEIMIYWADSVRANKKPINRLVAKILIFPKPIIYVAFVAALVITLIAGINTIQAIGIGISFSILKYIFIFIGAGYLSIALAKSVVMKLSFERLQSR